MLEMEGNLFNPPEGAFGICIPTNTTIAHRGKVARAVLTPGVALQASMRWPDFATVLGFELEHTSSAKVIRLTAYDAKHNAIMLGRTELPYHVFSFPVRRHYRDRANADIILRSARQLASSEEVLGFGPIYLPRFDQWDRIRPALEEILRSDQWRVISPKAGSAS